MEGLIRLAAPALPVPLRALVQVELRRRSMDRMRGARGVKIVLDGEALRSGPEIVVVGDSFVYGSLVAEREAFPAVLGRESGRSVLNLGVASQGPSMYTALTEFALEEAERPPRVLVYVLFGNDFRQYPEETSRARGAFMWKSDYEQDTSLRLRRIRVAVMQHFLTFQLVHLALTPESRHGPQESIPRAVYQSGEVALVFIGRAYWQRRLGPLNGRFDTGLGAALANVRRAQEACAAQDVRFVVALMPFKELVYGPAAVEQGAVNPVFYAEWYDTQYDRILTAVGELPVETLDLRTPLRAAAARGEQVYFTVDGHLNPRGHEVVAAALREALGLE